MRTVFIHGEVEQFGEAKEALIARFGTWCAARGVEAPGVLAEFLLDDKIVHDGLLAAWSERELQRFLVEVVPRRLALDGGWSAVPDFLHLWVDFLDETDLLMSDGSSLKALHEAIDRAVYPYLAAMADPAEWGPAKFWAVTMTEHGVDRDDDDAVERFFAGIDSGDVRVDEEIADHIEERDELEPVPQPAYWLPPMSVPDASRVESPATPIVARMRALCEWLGDGRKADELGALAEADLQELAERLDTDAFDAEIVLEWAKHAHLVRHAGHWLVRTQISGPLLNEPGLLWTKLWQSFVLLEDGFVAGDEAFDDLGDGAEVFLELVQHSLRTLYSHPEAVPLELIVDMAMSALVEDNEQQWDEVSVAARDSVRLMLRRMLAQWESLGAVRQFVTTQAEQVALIDEAVPDGLMPDHTMLELLPLGVEAARGSLQAFGFVVPTVDDMVDSPAEVLVLAMSDSPPEVVEEVVTAWVDKRGQAAASAELADLLRRVDDPLVRLTALWLLEQTGPAGVEAVRGVCDDPLGGPSARMWLRARPQAGGVAAEPDDELLFSLDGMAVSAAADAEVFLSEFRQQPTTDQIAVVERIPRSKHVCAGRVLEVIAEQHPDERVASVARRSLDKVHG